MGACAILPRIIGQGRASELLFTGRMMSAEEGERWGFHNRLVPADRCSTRRRRWRAASRSGPTFAHGITKTQLNTEWAVSLETAIEMEAQAQAICMATNDFRRAFEAFAAKRNAGVRGRLMADRASSTGRFSTTATANGRANLRLVRSRIWPTTHGEDVDAECRALVRKLGDGGWLRYCVPAAYGGVHEKLDVRSLALIRETLARHSGLADFAFAMQGLGSGTISLFGTEAQKQSYLPAVATGEKIAAFALTEPTSGSDVASRWKPRRARTGDGFIVDGAKTYISNGGIADFYVVFARTGEAPGAKGVSRLHRRRRHAGARRTASASEVIAPHPLATLKFDDMRLPAAALLGERGRGFAQAMATLDVFRTTVGAAALGLRPPRARRGDARAPSTRQLGGRHARRQCDRPVDARRDGARRRCLGLARLPRGLGARRAGPAQQPRGGARQAPRHRPRPGGDRQGGADFRRPRRHPRRAGRKPLPRNPRAAHLRGRLRGAEGRDRPQPSGGVRA